MNNNLLIPAAMPQTFSFSDVDEFRNSVRDWDIDFTPLAKTISAKQTILNLPGFSINFIESFPRLVDLTLSANCTIAGFIMEDGVPIRINGVENDRNTIVIGRNRASCSAVEPRASRLATVIFTPDVDDRDWPVRDGQFSMIRTTETAVRRLQQLASEIISIPLSAANEFELTATAAAIKESFLTALDDALSAGPGAKRIAHSPAQYQIFRRIEDAITQHLGEPIYSADLARQVGVSVRTLHNAIRRYRGMSLHQYLRLRRLWLVHQRLLTGTGSVKATALAMGFWHLSDFSRSYRIMFGETPSQTLARSK